MVKSVFLTDTGQRRKVNQDFIFASDTAIGYLPNVYLLADGMGGHAAGDTASRTCVETVLSQITGSFEKNPLRILGRAIEAANSAVFRKAREDTALNGMGTTLVAATCMGQYLQIANVGDSRLYVVSAQEIKQITRDHSYVEEMVRFGGISAREARNHPDKNIITRAIGAVETVEADFFTVQLHPGELVLLCSDGLSNMVEDEAIRNILLKEPDFEKKPKRLIDAANAGGGRDNISVILIDAFA